MREFNVSFEKDSDWFGLRWNNEELDCLDGEDYIGIDTETEKLIKGNPVVPVCMQVAYPVAHTVHLVPAEHIPAYMDKLFARKPGIEIVMHNAPFDIDVINDKRLFDKFWKQGSVIDTGIRYLLYGLETGYVHHQWSLEYVSWQLLGVVLDKDDAIRLTFKKDMDFDLNQVHVLYACRDPIATCKIRSILTEEMSTENLQRKAAYVLKHISDNGLLVDEGYRLKLEQQFKVKLDEAIEYLRYYGYVECESAWETKYDENKKAKSEKGSKQRLLDILEYFSNVAGVTLPRTEKRKQIQTTLEVVSDIFIAANKPVPPMVRMYDQYVHYNKLISTYLNPRLVGTDGRVHTFFSPILATGRTASSGPNIQNLPRKDNVRGQYVAVPGHVLCAVDYSQMELCILAEHCYVNYGESKLRELINEGIDVHAWFGDIIKQKTGGRIEGISFRSLAKAANFGLPGGLGAKTFVDFCRGYQVNITKEIALELKEIWLGTFPEMAKHLTPERDEEFTHRNIIKFSKEVLNCRYDTEQQLQSALRGIKGYDEEKIQKILRDVSAYQAKIISGRMKRNCTYCSASNYAFQAASADCAKMAMCLLQEANVKLVNFVHDEFIAEFPLDETLQDRVNQLVDLMVKGAQVFVKNTLIKAEPSLMYRWDKSAECLKDALGRFIVYMPSIQKATDDEKKLDSSSLVDLMDQKKAVPVWDKKGVLFGWKPAEDLHPELGI